MKKRASAALIAALLLLCGCRRRTTVPVKYSDYVCLGAWNDELSCFELSLTVMTQNEKLRDAKGTVVWFVSDDGIYYDEYGASPLWVNYYIIPDSSFKVSYIDSEGDEASVKYVRAEIHVKDKEIFTSLPWKLIYWPGLNDGGGYPADSDNDGLADSVEHDTGLDPFNEDTDNDGISDFEEYNGETGGNS